MNMGINPKHFTKAAVWEAERSCLEAIELVKNAGFRHLDICFNDRAETEQAAQYINDNGMTVIQSHMPYVRKGDFVSFGKSIMEHAENAKILGSKILVVHGDVFDFENDTYTPEKALEFNYRFFAKLVDFAAQNGMRVAFENLFQGDDPASPPRYCSVAEDLCRLADKYNTDTVGVCWDSGHGKVQYGPCHVEALKAAGSRVIATHIHDNYYNRDLHCFPFMGDTDWQAFMQALGGIGYKGDLTFEMVYDRLPKALAPDHLKLLYRSGEYLAKMM